MTDVFFETQLFCHAALAVSKTLLLRKQGLCKYKMRLEGIVGARRSQWQQHCAVALNELYPCLLAPNPRPTPPRKQTPPSTQRGQPQRPVCTTQPPGPKPGGASTVAAGVWDFLTLRDMAVIQYLAVASK